MRNLTQLRLAAREIFDEALRAVDAGAAMQREVAFDGARIQIGDASFDASFDIRRRNVYSIAVGKAALPMAASLEAILGEKLTAGVVAGPAVSRRETLSATNLSARWTLFEGGHPIPNEASLLAADAAFSLLEQANKQTALVVFLISGGGSAMIESPISSAITLEDLQNANRSLVNSGASIAEINSVRRAFSAIKGGRLAARALHCDQITLIVSDVPNGSERYVASGPSLEPAKDAPDAAAVVSRFDLRAKLPASIIKVIDNPALPSTSPVTRREHSLLLDNNAALEAASSAVFRRGFTTEIARDVCDEAIDVGCEKLLARVKSRHGLGNDICVISGGEFACPVRGDGLGGRNLETALRLACSIDSESGAFVALCAGTDGIDGNSPAAGAIVDSTTIERAKRIGLDAQDFLNRSDAYSFFVALGDVITTGPTGTNVRDLRILLFSGWS